MKLNPISLSETARYMGIKGTPDCQTAEILERYEKIVRERLRPAYVYKLTPVRFIDDGVVLEGINALFTGQDIRNHLYGCERAVVLAVTVSSEADKLIRQATVTGMTEALAVDCLCSTAVEQVCNTAEQEIFSEIPAPFRTWRFSAGYGDLPITLQKDLLTFLNAQRRIGLTATESCLLVPSKSVTAIIGISDTVLNNHKKGCDICNMRDRCGFRSEGGCRKSKK